METEKNNIPAALKKADVIERIADQENILIGKIINNINLKLSEVEKGDEVHAVYRIKQSLSDTVQSAVKEAFESAGWKVTITYVQREFEYSIGVK